MEPTALAYALEPERLRHLAPAMVLLAFHSAKVGADHYHEHLIHEPVIARRRLGPAWRLYTGLPWTM